MALRTAEVMPPFGILCDAAAGCCYSECSTRPHEDGTVVSIIGRATVGAPTPSTAQIQIQIQIQSPMDLGRSI